jgi:hypothetical protein
MSLRKADRFLKTSVVLAVGTGLLAALQAVAQYPGQVTKNSKDSPELRSIAVLEFTGDEGNPKASRLIPVAVLDAGRLQDGGIYLARPEPLAVVPEVEYELQQDGKPIGLFDIHNAGQQWGSWVGFGAWKPMPAPPRTPTTKDLAKTRLDDDAADDDHPVLHRKHHSGETPGAGTSGSGSDSGQSQPSDPNRPTLHKKNSSDSTDNSNTTPVAGGTGSSPTTASNPSTGTSPSSGSTSSTPTTASDPDRPTLHRKPSSSDSADSGSQTSSSSTDDPDRPVLKKNKKNPPPDVGSVESVADDTDPDRPRLKRGKSSGPDVDVAPSLMGFPQDLQQAVAVSDAKSRPPHPWDFAWSNPDDEAKMRASLEDMARDALGLNAPQPAAKPAPKRPATATRKSTKPAPPPPPPAPLSDEQFRVFELAYGSGATLVLSAHTDGPAAQQKFVTLVAQPDLYGNVLMLLKNVTDGAHLDEKPRMRLVDAVDAMADNRGELLFELRGATQRQFALYRVLRGQAEKLFVTGGSEFGTATNE